MSRAGMARIILEVRANTDTRENETVVNGVMYWTDDQIQEQLDLHRLDARDLPLTRYSEYEDGVNVYKRYYWPDTLGKWVERDDGFQVVDNRGVLATGYTVDYDGRMVLFDETTLGTEYFVRTRVFDINAAIAAIWLKKAGQRAELINWRAGGQALAEDDEYNHCMEQYRLYSGELGIRYTRLVRIGYNG